MQYDENAEKYGYEGEMMPLKCDELKKSRIVLSTEGHLSGHVEWFKNVYNAEDVDAAIAELKDVIHELQVDLEGAKATAYADSVDAGMRERRLKRASWLARAERAKSEKGFWVYKYNEDCGEFNYTIASRSLASDEWMRVWENVELKCLKKAKEYK